MVLSRYLWPLILGAGLTAACVPGAVFLGRRLGAVDQPGGRRINERPVPRLGGLAIAAGFLVALAFLPHRDRTMLPLVLAGALAYLLGFLDDLRGLRPGLKLAGQIAIAAILPACGVAVRFLSNPWGGMFSLGWLAWPATIVWVVALMNMVNLTDGLDGLAAGITAIAAASLLFLPQCYQRPFVATLCLLTIGCALGFLPFNFHPARTFMGDGGAYFLGFVLGFITVTGALKGRAALTLSLPLLALAVPFFDTASAVLRRWRKGQPVFEADRDHLHHRLLFAGLSHRRSVLVLYLSSAVFGIGSNFAARLGARSGTALLLGMAACAALGIRRLERAGNGTGRSGDGVAPPAGGGKSASL